MSKYIDENGDILEEEFLEAVIATGNIKTGDETSGRSDEDVGYEYDLTTGFGYINAYLFLRDEDFRYLPYHPNIELTIAIAPPPGASVEVMNDLLEKYGLDSFGYDDGYDSFRDGYIPEGTAVVEIIFDYYNPWEKVTNADDTIDLDPNNPDPDAFASALEGVWSQVVSDAKVFANKLYSELVANAAKKFAVRRIYRRLPY